MNETSASPADQTPQASAGFARIPVWDAPVRVFHWLMVFSFAGAYLTAESEHWRLLHVALGYTMAGLVAFRIVWGFVGTRHARFSNFVRGPRAVLRYLRSMSTPQPEHYTGHNPLGALAILAMLGLTVAIALTGWIVFNDAAAEATEGLHELAANAMLTVVGVHVAGVLFASWRGRENLIGAMISGRKQAPSHDGVRNAWRVVAALMLVGVAGFWWVRWDAASMPTSDEGPSAGVSHAKAGDHDDD